MCGPITIALAFLDLPVLRCSPTWTRTMPQVAV